MQEKNQLLKWMCEQEYVVYELYSNGDWKLEFT